MPGIHFVADFFAIHANGKHALEPLDSDQGSFQFLHSCPELQLKPDDERGNANSGFQLGRVERFGEIIIRAGLQTG